MTGVKEDAAARRDVVQLAGEDEDVESLISGVSQSGHVEDVPSDRVALVVTS